MLGQLPAPLDPAGRADTLLRLRVGDDVAADRDRIASLTLHVLLSDPATGDLPADQKIDSSPINPFWDYSELVTSPPERGIENRVQAWINGVLLKKATIEKGWLVFRPGAEVFAVGENLVGLLLAGRAARETRGDRREGRSSSALQRGINMLYEKLQAREAEGKPVHVGVIGAGTFGTQLIAQTCRMKGLRIAAVAELDLDRAREALRLGGVDRDRIPEAENDAAVNDAIRSGTPVVTPSADALIQSEIDVLVEATGVVDAGASHAFKAIETKKHVVMVTVEADVVVGHVLKQKADAAGVLYSMAYGDEPALAFELCDWARGARLPGGRVREGDALPHQFFASTTPTMSPGSTASRARTTTPRCSGPSWMERNTPSRWPRSRTPPAWFRTCAACTFRPPISARSRTSCARRRGEVSSGRKASSEAVSAIGPGEVPVERNLRGGLYAVIDAPGGFSIDSLASYGEIIGMIVGKKSNYAMIYRPQHFIGHEMPLTIARMISFGQTCGAPGNQDIRGRRGGEAPAHARHRARWRGRLHRLRDGRARHDREAGETSCPWD